MGRIDCPLSEPDGACIGRACSCRAPLARARGRQRLHRTLFETNYLRVQVKQLAVAGRGDAVEAVIQQLVSTYATSSAVCPASCRYLALPAACAALCNLLGSV